MQWKIMFYLPLSNLLFGLGVPAGIAAIAIACFLKDCPDVYAAALNLSAAFQALSE